MVLFLETTNSPFRVQGRPKEKLACVRSTQRRRNASADEQDRARTRGRTAIGPLPLGAFRSAENSAFEEKMGWREIRPGWTVPQGSVKFHRQIKRREFLRTPRIVAVTCMGSRGVSEIALLWPDGDWAAAAGVRNWGLGLQTASSQTAAAIGRRVGELSRLRRAICTGRSRRAAGMVGLVSARATSSLIITRFVRFPKMKVEVFWQSRESFFRRGRPRRPLCGLFSGGPQKSLAGVTTTTSDGTMPRDATYEFRRGTSHVGRRTFLAWTQKKSLFSAPKKPKKSGRALSHPAERDTRSRAV
jgi:hypothetical protein